MQCESSSWGKRDNTENLLADWPQHFDMRINGYEIRTGSSHDINAHHSSSSTALYPLTSFEDVIHYVFFCCTNLLILLSAFLSWESDTEIRYFKKSQKRAKLWREYIFYITVYFPWLTVFSWYHYMGMMLVIQQQWWISDSRDHFCVMSSYQNKVTVTV